MRYRLGIPLTLSRKAGSGLRSHCLTRVDAPDLAATDLPDDAGSSARATISSPASLTLDDDLGSSYHDVGDGYFFCPFRSPNKMIF